MLHTRIIYLQFVLTPNDSHVLSFLVLLLLQIYNRNARPLEPWRKEQSSITTSWSVQAANLSNFLSLNRNHRTNSPNFQYIWGKTEGNTILNAFGRLHQRQTHHVKLHNYRPEMGWCFLISILIYYVVTCY